MKKIWFVSLCIFGFLACEKDDICAGEESVTPNIVIDLYDEIEPENLKQVVKIAAVANSFTDTLFFETTSKIELPLQINTNATDWNLTLYELTPTNETILKKDELKFTY